MNEQDRTSLDVEFEKRTKAVFDESVSSIDARTRSRLTQARYAAVAQLEQGNTRWLRLWMPVAGLAAAVLLAVFIVVPGMNARLTETSLADDDMPLLLDSENVELLEDMEFYAWLDEDVLDSAVKDPGSAESSPSRNGDAARS